MSEDFGAYIRDCREARRARDRSFSLRQVARRLDLEPSYLSKIERGLEAPSEKVVVALAGELGEDPDVLLAMVGKVSSDLREVICRRPRIFADLLRQLRGQPDHAILRVVREVRDGEW